MVNLQKEFIDFHNEIKLDDENQILRDKRDILLKKLKENISEDAATYTTFNQGSYAMGTGVKPEEEDYDIDVGIRFSIDHEDYEDPIVPKQWVRDALDGHTKSVKIRRSCVTVTYQKENEPIYHVDFAIYANNNDDGNMYIAKGKEFSDDSNKFWELSDPLGLIEEIDNKFTEAEDRYQFKRIIRYMKKWKMHNSNFVGNGVPTGIALTVLAYDHFTVSKEYDPYKLKYTYNDFEALRSFVLAIKNSFELQYSSKTETFYHNIASYLPVEPKNNLFEKMTENQLETLYQEVISMLAKLDEAATKTKKYDACEILVEIFGKDFPVTVDKSMVGTSESA